MVFSLAQISATTKKRGGVCSAAKQVFDVSTSVEFQISRTKSRERSFDQFSYKQFTKVHSRPGISQPTPVPPQAAVPATLVDAPAAIQETPISAPSVVPAATPLKASPPLPPPGILTPPSTVEIPPPSKQKRKLPRIQFRSYLDDDDEPKRRSRRIHRHQPYKYSKDESD